MAKLTLETLSIVGGTLDEMSAAQPVLMLRMWHHLDGAPDREAIFETVGGDGREGLVEAFLSAVRQRLGGHWPRLRGSDRLCGDHIPVLEEAFARALADVAGVRTNPWVATAWRAMLRDFLDEMCAPKGRPS